MFFQPRVAVETRGLRTYSSQSRSRAGKALAGLGDADVGVIIGQVGGAAASIIGSIFGAQSSASAASAAQANAQATAAFAAAQAEQASQATTKTVAMVLGGVAIVGLGVYAFTR